MAKDKKEKLVRDKIPEIIRGKGEDCKVRVPRSKKEKRKFADKKLEEEVAEYLTERSRKGNAYSKEKVLEELADIQELILHLASLEGFSAKELSAYRKAKNKSRGGFTKSFIWTKQENK